MDENSFISLWGEKYISDPLISLAMVELEWKKTFPDAKKDRKSIGSLFKANGFQRSEEVVRESRVLLGRIRLDEIAEERRKEFEAMLAASDFKSPEGIVAGFNSGVSIAKMEHHHGLKPKYILPILKEAGCTIEKTQDTSYLKVIEAIQERGITGESLKIDYLEERKSFNEIHEAISGLYSSVTKKQTEKILRHYGIKKDSAALSHARGAGGRQERADNLSLLAQNGYSQDDLVKLYDEDLSQTFSSIAKLVNSLGPNTISVRWIERIIKEKATSSTRSRVENQFGQWLAEVYSGKIDRNNRKLLAPYEVDFYLPELMLAIEFNGDYWHSEKFIMENHGMSSGQYHLNKKIRLQDLGINLIYVWESDWLQKGRSVKAGIERALAGAENSPSILGKIEGTKRRDFAVVNNIFFHEKTGNIHVKEVGPKEKPFQVAKDCSKIGIKAILVYPWDDPKSIAKLVFNKTSAQVEKLSARKLDLREVSQKETNLFLAKEHIQGGVRGQKKCYGLFRGEELLAVATFGISRYSKKYQWEFLRYAVRDGIIIHGGSGRLYKEFIEQNLPDSVVSYVDYSHTTGTTFLPTLGFTEIRPTGPGAVWWNKASSKKVSHVSLIRQGADRLLGTTYGSTEACGLNNEQIMEKEGFVKLPTAGNRVFVWSAKS